MSTVYAGLNFNNVEDLRFAVSTLLGEAYRVYTDRSGMFLDVHYVDPINYQSKIWSVPIRDFKQLIAFAMTDEQATTILKEYLWSPVLPKGLSRKENNCNHEFKEELLFNLTEERCRFCGIKK